MKPVFVFDGGAPVLKRRTVGKRKERREGRREDAVRTAGKLLAVQMQRRMAEEEEKEKQRERERGSNRVGKGGREGEEKVEEEEVLPENLVYVEELQMTPQERMQKRKFRRKDAYHLPELDTPLTEMGAANDPRIMSMEELQNYARQFDSGEDINVYDFSKIDFDSSFFQSLPDSDRYNILNAARLRSRLRMGYSKDQLDTMFPDRMAFSKFQIDRVRERNELTQRLMNVTGMADDKMFGGSGGGRIAGEKGREYVLVKNDGVEGGWALGVVDNKEGKVKEKPIDVDELHRVKEESMDSDGDEEEEDEFEDIPVQGLNRLPTRPAPKPLDKPHSTNNTQKRQQLYNSRKKQVEKPPRQKAVENEAEDSLFLAEEDAEEWEDVQMGHANGEEEEEAQLQRAITMSLQNDDNTGIGATTGGSEDRKSALEIVNGDDDSVGKPTKFEELAQIARTANLKASDAVAGQGVFAYNDSDDDDDDDDGFSLHAALDEARQSKRKPAKPNEEMMANVATPAPASSAMIKNTSTTRIAERAGFSGPLPFEKLNLGTSLLGKKKAEKRDEELEGGFEREADGKKGRKEEKRAEPLPPWFSNADGEKDRGNSVKPDEGEMDIGEEQKASNAAGGDDNDNSQLFHDAESVSSTGKKDESEVINGDSPDQQYKMVIDVDEPGDGSSKRLSNSVSSQIKPDKDDDELIVELNEASDKVPEENRNVTKEKDEDSDEALEWEDSDHEEQKKQYVDSAGVDQAAPPPEPNNTDTTNINGDKPDITPPAPEPPIKISISLNNYQEPILPEIDNQALIDADADDDGFISDPEEEELIRQLAIEADEHDRFTASLHTNDNTANPNNQIVPPHEQPDFDRQLKALRNQQKKDRRDADEITQSMITECQQLLSLFGLPYITAPMEAEAQCARLVDLGLVDGIVTDDSDIFLFGGTRVYKNMFNQAKFVECYLFPDIASELGLDRTKLISISHLLGSDYTEGLPGIGPVTALEILSEFDSLAAFRDWYAGVQQGLIPKAADASSPFRRKFRRNATKLFLPPAFPDARVDEAYFHPEVDSDTQPFEWGVPHLAALRSFLSGTVGWTEERTDEILVPVIRDMNRREAEGTQANITRFFKGGVGAGAFAPRRKGVVGDGGGLGVGAGVGSKRLGMALGKMASKARGEESVAEDENTKGDVVDGTDGVEERQLEGRTKDQSTVNGSGKAKRRPSGRSRNKVEKKIVDGGDDVDRLSGSSSEDEYRETTAKAKKSRKSGSKKSTNSKKRRIEA